MTSPPGIPPPAAPAAGTTGPADSPAGAATPVRLGPYPIEREIGRGGMGVVYLGRDTRLDRPVALKVLPADLTAGGERLARFEREARILAQLRHPNIAGIYSLEEDDGRHFLALEYVEGETLAERIPKGPLPPVEAVEIARQVAAAVEAAHESGVIHRDLKPGNVKITPAGDVRVLDFGLAKEVGVPTGSPNSSMSPTLTFAATQMGLVLGTAAYMSPEQARGRELDRRTDIWSFGCVLYECLTGRQAFAGETISDVIAGVLEREPDWDAIPREVPDRVRELLARCLAKDPKQRLRDIGDARIALDEVLALRSASGRLPAARESGPWRRARARGNPAALAALVGAVALALGAWLGAWLAPRADRALRVVSIALPGGWKLRGGAITRDGRFVTAVGVPPGASVGRMLARPIGSPDFRELPGTEGFQNSWTDAERNLLYFTMAGSPDGGDRRLLRVSLSGDTPAVPFGVWRPGWLNLGVLPDGVLVTDGPLSYCVLSADGQPSPSRTMQVTGATGVTRVEVTSQALPAHQGALVNVISYDARGWHDAVGVLEVPSGRVKVVIEDGGNAVWLGSNLLAFVRSRLIYAVRFDPRRRVASGPAVLVWSGLRTTLDAAPGSFRVTDAGDIYHAPAGANAGRAMAVLGANGKLTMVSDRRPLNSAPDIAPDRRTYVTDVVSARGLDELWIGDLRQKGPLRRIASDDEADCSSPVWSSDGNEVAYRRHAENARDGIYAVDVTTGSTRRLLNATRTSLRPLTWLPDGRLLLVQETPGHNRILVLPAGAAEADSSVLRPLHPGADDERGARVSRDGRWLAWLDNASGAGDVLVESVAAPGRPLRIAGNGAWQCQWALDRPDLYYSQSRALLLKTTITAGATGLAASPPDTVADLQAQQVAAWAAADHGDVLVALRSDDETEIPHYLLVQNWVDEVKRRMRAPDASTTATR